MILLWLGFMGLVGVLLLLHRKMSTPTLRSAAYWTVTWFVIGIAFVGLVYPMYEHAWLGATLDEPSDSPGADASVMFVSAYLLEYALSFDVVIVVLLQCELHRIPRRHRPRVVFWGLVGAIFFRLFILTSTACLARTSTWALYVLGALFLYSGVRALMPDSAEREVTTRDVETVVGQRKYMPFATTLWRLRRLTAGLEHDGRLWVIEDGRRVLTMVAACVAGIVLVDIVFALESAVAVVSASKTSFIVVTSNVLATIAVRSWFFVLGTIENPRFPRTATAVLLCVIGAKLLAHKHLDVSPVAWLLVTSGLAGVCVAESVMLTRRSVR